MQFVRSAFALVVAASAVPALATVQTSADFSTYANGNLVGQNGWAQQGTSVLNPLQVTNGQVVIPGLAAGAGNTDNQDAVRAFSPVLSGNGNSVFVGASITVNAAFAPNSTVGSAFILALNSTDATPFQNLRLVARQGTEANTFQFGLRATGQSQNQPFFTNNLSFGTTYNLVLAYNFVTGSLNDTVAGFVSTATPTAGSQWGSSTLGAGEAPGFQGLVISQFANTTQSQTGLTIGRLVVADTFAEAAGFVPTPGTAALVGLAGLAAARRRR